MAERKLIHVGCGLSVGPSWESYDSSPTLRLRRLPLVGSLLRPYTTPFPREVRYGDIVRGRLCGPGAADAVFASHVLEHLARADARCALANIFAMLKPGGVFRVVVPDLESRARRYLDDVARGEAAAADRFLEDTQLGRAERPRGLVGGLRALWGAGAHLWMYDDRSMERLLREAGFADIRRCTFGDGALAAFAEVESAKRFASRLGPEVAFECRRPAAPADTTAPHAALRASR
jgi:SAM-dependent methyltransferase